MLDMIRPASSNRITLQDLKRCKMTPVFFDTFFNLEKYLDHEQRDPFATQREVDEDGNEVGFRLINDYISLSLTFSNLTLLSFLTGTDSQPTSTSSLWPRKEAMT